MKGSPLLFPSSVILGELRELSLDDGCLQKLLLKTETDGVMHKYHLPRTSLLSCNLQQLDSSDVLPVSLESYNSKDQQTSCLGC